MKEVVYITGHKNPDSDSICAAIAYSEFKNKTNKNYDFVPLRQGEPNRETQFILDSFGVKSPLLLTNIEEKDSKQKLILVDHSEIAQAIDGLSNGEIIEIIDHHRIGDVQTSAPIFYRNQPIGSSSTIVGLMFFENGLTPSKEAAGLLCGAIISDTLMFRSPTTTDTDKEVLKKLSEIAGIVPEDFAAKMFKAGTSLEGKTVDEIFNQDYKAFNLSGHKVGVAQVTTMDIDGFQPMKKDMLSFMNKKIKEENFNVLLLLLTDIIKEGSQLIAAGPDSDIVSKAFNLTLKDSSAYAPGILSRKKQVIPPITDAFEGK